MIDLKAYREDRASLGNSLSKRGVEVDLDALFGLEAELRKAMQKTDELRSRRNQLSGRVAKEKLSAEERESIVAEVKGIGQEIKALDEAAKGLQDDLQGRLHIIPNVLDPSVPEGRSAEDNPVVMTDGEPTKLDFKPQDHVALGEKLGVFSFEAGVKLSGSRFTLLKSMGARLERALANFMLDLHVNEHGYSEFMPPLMVNAECLFGTGQLPKFEEDLFKTTSGHYLIPTAEVPLTNIHSGEVIPADKLPLPYVAWTPCFRSEAGSYGKDTKGYIRQHQFNKVELVWITHPDKSGEAHEMMRSHAEKVLRLLGLPFRTVLLCSGDIGFSARKCYDIEVWLPGQDKYREISSCSNCGDFQARRANIRYKDAKTGETGFVHTLNGSGVAVGRALVAVLENFQRKDGSVAVPKVLQKYLNGLTEIQPQ